MNDYARWLKEVKDPLLLKELKGMDEKSKQDAFYKDLEFGTGGLRGVIGAGSNRLNIYTVAKISQGIANYLLKHCPHPSIAIAYDSRINSTLFAKTAAGVYAKNGIKTFIYPVLMPTPTLSYAIRYLHCSAGIIITASHNPKEYNGYKVYNDSGCQITLEAANEISGYIESLDVFTDIRQGDFEQEMKTGIINYIGPDCLDSFLKYIATKEIKDVKNRDLKIIYSPLNGTGLIPVTRALKNAGYNDITVVPEQEYPDGNFTTCPKPNPELKEALALGINLLEKEKADLLLVTDPDCDRCGTAVMHKGEIRLISGNEMGVLLFDFLLHHKEHVPHSVLVKTIVTTDMVLPMAKEAGFEVKEVLTGFKFIGEQIGLLEQKGEENRYFFGFEESYGYLSGTEVRDKDAVDASYLIVQMMQYYKDNKIDPLDHLEELYKKFGYNTTSLDTFEFKGEAGALTMKKIMEVFREKAKTTSEFAYVNDYLSSEHYEDNKVTKIDLPSSDVLKFAYPDGSTITVRPSGTEPKLKVYYYIVAKEEKHLAGRLEVAKNQVKSLLNEFLK